MAVAEYFGYIHLATAEGPATATVDYSTVPPSDVSGSVSKSVSDSKLTISSMPCYTIDNLSVSTLGSAGVASPSSEVDIFGGLQFTISCTAPGGSADASIALGEYYDDLSVLRVYKTGAAGELIDITSQVSLTNQDDQTVLRYTLIDGRDYDDDGEENGIIVDPVYFVIVNTSASDYVTSESGGDVLAQTGSPFIVYILTSGTLLALGVGTIAGLVRRSAA